MEKCIYLFIWPIEAEYETSSKLSKNLTLKAIMSSDRNVLCKAGSLHPS